MKNCHSAWQHIPILHLILVLPHLRIDRNIYGESASLAWHTVYINRAFKQLYQHTDNGKSESKPLFTLSTR